MKRLFPFFLLLLFSAPAWAQVDSSASTEAAAPADTSGSVLPDITPREFEIRGQLEISFPSLERQPLVGFNPPPRVRLIPPDQKPFIGEYKQESADLPPSPLARPDAPPISSLETGAPRGGLVEASGGRYYTRIAKANLAIPATGATAFHAELNYSGSDGYLASEEVAFVDDPDVRTPYDALKASIGVTTTQQNLRAGGTLDGFANAYTLYGTLQDDPDANNQPNRRGGGIGGTAWIEGEGGTFSDLALQVGYSGAGYETDVFATDDDDFRRLQQRVDGSGRLGVLAAGGEIVADASASSAGLDEGGPFSDAARVFSGGAGYRFVARGTINLTLGARYLAFSSNQPRPSGRGSRQNVSGSYVAPDVRLDLYPSPTLRVYALSEPGAYLNGLAELYEENPYLVDEPYVLPTVRQFDAEGGAELFAGPVQIKLWGGYERYPSFLFFEHAITGSGLPYSRGLHTANYAEATVLHGGGDLSVALPSGLSALLSVTVRDGYLQDGGEDIPYFAPVVGEATVSYAFAERRGLLQLTSRYESKRFIDREQTRKVGDYVDLDLLASYDVASYIGLVARLENLAVDALERWEGYPQPPLIVTAGFRVMW